MKVWELEEGKEYTMVKNKTFKMRLKDGAWEYYHARLGEWKYSTERINTLKDYDFEEVVDTNSHWKPNRERIAFIDHDFDSVKISNFLLDNTEDVNMFHVNDKKKVECLALEFKIKSVLLNWRSLHDDVELDWEDNKNNKHFISCDLEDAEIDFDVDKYYCEHLFGYFSKKEKAQQFYQYMKEDIDKYFQMRKELKF